MVVDFTLNGRPVSVDVRDGETLLDMLRERFGVTSVKDGCAPEGSCGACTVLVDGRARVSCAQAARHAEGREIVTQEGLDDDERRRWADAFVVAGASQCGFCSPGIVMKAEGLLAKQAAPTREEIAHGLAGNLCRCTGYVKVIDAIDRVARERRGEPVPPPPSGDGVGARAPRYQGSELALGDKPYVADMLAPEMVHGAIRFSDHPRARVLRIDVAEAKAHPGVVAVATAADVPGERTQGLITRDWRQLVAEGEVTAYVGDVLAVVAAESRHAAREAAALIEVEYDVLEPVTDPIARARRGRCRRCTSGATCCRPRSCSGATSTPRSPRRRTCCARRSGPRRSSTRSSSRRRRSPCPTATATTCTRRARACGRTAARSHRSSAMPEPQIRVTQVSNGGAFGAKEDLNVQCHAALLARVTGRPALLVLSRAESLRFHPKRHPMVMDYTIGADAEGRLTALRARIVGDTGAYASVGDKVLERAAGHACGAYEVPNVDVEARAVYTNNPPCGAMRGFGVNQVTFAVDGMLDRLAERVGVDGWEIRYRNALEVGKTFGTGQVLGPGVGIKACLEAVRDAYRDAEFAGIGCGVKNTGIGNGLPEHGKAVLRPEADGSVTLFHSWTEMGQGVHTALRQVACEELGLPAERVHVVVDTERELDTGQTTASRSTVLGGLAVIDAAGHLRAALDGGRLEDLAGREFRGQVTFDHTTPPGADVEHPVTHFAYGWAVQVVLLDDDGRLRSVIAAHDVGKAVNPTLLEGQIEGAVHMGLGFALTEAFVVDGGRLVTDTLKSQGIIPPAGMPPVEVVLVEVPQPEGPYGAKGVGEIGLVPTAAAVAGALHAYEGRWRTDLPMKDSPAAVGALPKLAAAGRREG